MWRRRLERIMIEFERWVPWRSTTSLEKLINLKWLDLAQNMSFEFRIRVISIQFDKNVILQSPWYPCYNYSRRCSNDEYVVISWRSFECKHYYVENLLTWFFGSKYIISFFWYGLVKLVLGWKVLFPAILVLGLFNLEIVLIHPTYFLKT